MQANRGRDLARKLALHGEVFCRPGMAPVTRMTVMNAIFGISGRFSQDLRMHFKKLFQTLINFQACKL
jgi:hypothetical protein